jgi:hypothetical protein
VYYRKDFNRLAELLGSQEPRKNKIRVGELYKEQEQKVPQPDEQPSLPTPTVQPPPGE